MDTMWPRARRNFEEDGRLWLTSWKRRREGSDSGNPFERLEPDCRLAGQKQTVANDRYGDDVPRKITSGIPASADDDAVAAMGLSPSRSSTLSSPARYVHPIEPTPRDFRQAQLRASKIGSVLISRHRSGI